MKPVELIGQEHRVLVTVRGVNTQDMCASVSIVDGKEIYSLTIQFDTLTELHTEQLFRSIVTDRVREYIRRLYVARSYAGMEWHVTI